MIKNWNYHALHMDFSSMYIGNDHPSDIDMMYLCDDGTLILGEIKHRSGEFKIGQRKLMQKIIDMHEGDGFGLYITHNKKVQNGDKVVDVSRCMVEEIYCKWEGKWRNTKQYTTVGEVFEYLRERGRCR